MKGLDAIIKNPIVKATLFKQLEKVMKDNGIKLIAITMDDNGKIDFIPYTDEVKIISKDKLNELIKLATNENK